MNARRTGETLADFPGPGDGIAPNCYERLSNEEQGYEQYTNTRAATIDRQRCVTSRSNNIVDRVVVVVMSAPSRLRIFNILVDEHVTLASLFFRDHEEANSEKKKLTNT